MTFDIRKDDEMKTVEEMMQYVDSKNYKWNVPKEYFVNLRNSLASNEVINCVIPTGGIELNKKYVTDAKSLIAFTKSKIIFVGGKPFSKQVSPVSELILNKTKNITTKKMGLGRFVVINGIDFELSIQVHKNDLEKILDEIQNSARKAISDNKEIERKQKILEEEFKSSKPIGKKISYTLNGEDIEVIFNHKALYYYNCTKLTKTEIKKENILFYKLVGDIQYTSEISGGGVNLGTAVTGGLLFGVAGAIVGASVGTDIKTSTNTHDNRTVEIWYYSSGNIHTQAILILPVSCYELLLKFFPEKEQSAAMIASDQKKEPKSFTKEVDTSVIAQLKDLKELMDSGVITKDEFNKLKLKLFDV